MPPKRNSKTQKRSKRNKGYGRSLSRRSLSRSGRANSNKRLSNLEKRAYLSKTKYRSSDDEETFIQGASYVTLLDKGIERLPAYLKTEEVPDEVELPEELSIDDVIIPRDFSFPFNKEENDELFQDLYKTYYFKSNFDFLELKKRAIDVSGTVVTLSPESLNSMKRNGIEKRSGTLYKFEGLGLYIRDTRTSSGLTMTPGNMFDEFRYNQPFEPIALPRDYEYIKYFYEIPIEYPPLSVYVFDPITTITNTEGSQLEEYPGNDLLRLQCHTTETFETNTLTSLFYSPVAVYCLKEDGSLVLAPYTQPWRHVLKHRVLCSFGNNTKVICAGHITVDQKQIYVDMLSGTFQPDEVSMQTLNSLLRKMFSEKFTILMSSEADILKITNVPHMSHPDAPISGD